MTDRRHQQPEADLRALHQLHDRGALHDYPGYQRCLAKSHIKITPEITRRLRQAERLLCHFIKRQRGFSHQLRKMVGME